MTAEQAPEVVDFVHRHKGQVGQEGSPVLPVPGQDGVVEHVRIGDDQAGPVAEFTALRDGHVAVVGGHVMGLEGAACRQRGRHVLKLDQLIAGQRLRRSHVDGPGIRVADQAVQDRQLVAQRLAAGRGSGDEHILPGPNQFQGQALMAVEPLAAQSVQHATDMGMQPFRHVGPLRRSGRESFRMGDVGLVVGIRPHVGQQFGNGDHGLGWRAKRGRSGWATRPVPANPDGLLSLNYPYWMSVRRCGNRPAYRCFVYVDGLLRKDLVSRTCSSSSQATCRQGDSSRLRMVASG